MTKTPNDACTLENRTAAIADAESRLARSRSILRQHLSEIQANREAGMAASLGGLARMAFPLVSKAVRRNAYASVGGALLAGMLLMRWKPWRGLGGSVLAGLLARQALAFLASRRGVVLHWLMAATQTARKPDRSGRGR